MAITTTISDKSGERSVTMSSAKKLVTVLAVTDQLPYILDFSQLTALPSNWVGATAAISAGKLIITPTLSAEMATDGGLENWASATNMTSWDEGLGGTSTVNQETIVIHGGSNSARLDIDASNNYAYFQQSKTINADEWLRVSYWLQTAAADKFGYCGLGAVSGKQRASATTFSQFTDTVRAAVNNPNLIFNRASSASLSLYFDDISAKSLTKSTTITYLNKNKSRVGSVKVGANILYGNPIGVVGWWDAGTVMQNCLFAVYDGEKASLVKYVGSTRTELIAPTAATYVAGRSLQIKKTAPTTFQLLYNGTQVGTDQTVSDAEIIYNQKFGVFSTHESNELLTFQLDF